MSAFSPCGHKTYPNACTDCLLESVEKIVNLESQVKDYQERLSRMDQEWTRLKALCEEKEFDIQRWIKHSLDTELALRNKIDSLRSSLTQAQTALEKYGRHFCNSSKLDNPTCTCGFDAAISTVLGEK